MNLLLLLSALLSALTGAGTVVRAPVAAAALARPAAETRETASQTASFARRPEQWLPAIRDVASASADPGVAPAVFEPLFATRRRE